MRDRLWDPTRASNSRLVYTFSEQVRALEASLGAESCCRHIGGAFGVKMKPHMPHIREQQLCLGLRPYSGIFSWWKVGLKSVFLATKRKNVGKIKEVLPFFSERLHASVLVRACVHKRAHTHAPV